VVHLQRRLLIDYYLGGLLHVVLKPLVVFLGFVLRRDHRLGSCTSVTYVKLLGGVNGGAGIHVEVRG
jgi:hypothetical protein